MTRRDWWLGVLLIVLALLVHGLVPRYDYRPLGNSSLGAFSRFDRWTGGADVIAVTGRGREWVQRTER